MWILFSLVLAASAAPSRKLLRETTGGIEALEVALRDHRDVLLPYRKAGLAERREEVRRALEHAGCALDLHSGRPEPSADARFLMDLLTPGASGHLRAYARLVTNPPEKGEVKTQTFHAVFALIEAELRSPFVRMFLRMQRTWPAPFANRLRDFAARGCQGDRVYVVNLIRAAEKTGDPQVRRSFRFESDAELDEIISSNGERLWGRGFRGAAPE